MNHARSSPFRVRPGKALTMSLCSCCRHSVMLCCNTLTPCLLTARAWSGDRGNKRRDGQQSRMQLENETERCIKTGATELNVENPYSTHVESRVSSRGDPGNTDPRFTGGNVHTSSVVHRNTEPLRGETRMIRDPRERVRANLRPTDRRSRARHTPSGACPCS